jgi:hypothetical protein
MRLRTLLLSAGWLLFVISFFIPAVSTHSYVRDLPGWAAAYFSFLSLWGVLQSVGDGIELRGVFIGGLALCNVIVILSLPIVLLRKELRSLKIGLAVAALLVCAAGIFPQLLFPTSLGDSTRMEFLAGYYLWALSFVLLAVGVNLKRRTKEATS